MTALQASKENVTDKTAFRHLPGFAKFIRENCLVSYVREQVRLSREVNMPLLKFFATMSDEELVTIGISSHAEFLASVEGNNVKEHVEKNLQNWRNNQMNLIGRDDVMAEDIVLGTYIRKQAMMKFVYDYTQNTEEIIEIIKEIDKLNLNSDIAATNLYLEILREKIEENHEQLTVSDRLYKQAEALSHIGNWSWDLVTNKIKWSEELFRIYGLEPAEKEINYGELSSFNHADDAAFIREITSEAAISKKPYDFYYRIILQTGQVKTLHAKGQVTVDNDGHAIEMHGTLQDVTEQKEAERRIKEYQEFIEKIADTAPAIIASYNINTGIYSFISKGITKLLGYETMEVLLKGTSFFMDIIHPDDLAATLDKNSKALEDANKGAAPQGEEAIVEFKYRMRHKDGQYLWFHTYGIIFDRNSRGMVENVLNISIDITEQEEAEKTLWQKNKQLEQSNASLEEYAYVASHDLKEPLRKIATFSDRLLTSYGSLLNGSAQMFLDKIIESSRRMQNMINDLLSVSMIAGQKTLYDCDLQAVLEESLQALDHSIEEKKATINSDGLPTVRVIPSQMRQLFQNLIGNSLKFSQPGTQPAITITHRYLNKNQASEHGLPKTNKYLEIILADNGIGFDNQFAEKIFTIFQRLHGKGDYEGTGIGLAICKKIAENHGGIIFANGIPNTGAKFTIIIPV